MRGIKPILWTGILPLLLSITGSVASWGSPGQGQYHIQTDEGPERYFRYLTDNGQYRKEKRLQDGTVIGTDAWIDASGVLRQKDYIADGDGYRILKSKTIYIGKGQTIEDALRSLKESSKFNHDKNTNYIIKAAPSTEKPLLNYNQIPSVTPAPLYYDHPVTPSVYVRPNSQPFDAAAQFKKIPIPSIEFQPPFNDLSASYPSSTISPSLHDIIQPIADYSTPRPTPISATEQLPITSTLNNELLPPYLAPSITPFDQDQYFTGIVSTTPRPAVAITTEDNSAVYPTNSPLLEPRPLYTRPDRRKLSYSARNPFYRELSNNLGNGDYDSQFSNYDGVAIHNNGFRYYLPRHYHEEETDGDRRSGSFGYIDPFGIRRVVYYNASPKDGFVHKKNNRYVGFNATPYDPRP